MKLKITVRVELFMILALLGVLGACTRTEVAPKSLKDEIQDGPQGTLRSVDVAEAISSGDFSIGDFQDLAKWIQVNAIAGYGEKVFLSDFSNLRSGESSFASKLLQKLPTSPLRSLEHTNFSLYWPDCTLWDKKELPTIAYVATDTPDDVKEIPAFQLNDKGEVIGTIMINEEYTLNHPTIIVNNSEKPKGKAIPLRPSGYVSSIIIPELSKIDFFTEKVRTLYLGQLQVTKQFDPWIKGGSEICFVVAYPRAIKDTDGTIKFEERETLQFREVSRSDIKNKKVLDLDYDLISDWDENLDLAKFYVYEDDELLGLISNIKFKFNYKGFGLEMEVEVPKNREKICQVDYTGKVLMSSDNIDPNSKEWRMHRANGVNYTLPIKVSTVLPDWIFDGPHHIYP